MNYLGAMRETMETWALAAGLGWDSPIKIDQLSFEYCSGLLHRCETTADITAETLNYRLGWMHAAAVASGALTVDNISDILKRWL